MWFGHAWYPEDESFGDPLTRVTRGKGTSLGGGERSVVNFFPLVPTAGSYLWIRVKLIVAEWITMQDGADILGLCEFFCDP